jgi:hypothetical protein
MILLGRLHRVFRSSCAAFPDCKWRRSTRPIRRCRRADSIASMRRSCWCWWMDGRCTRRFIQAHRRTLGFEDSIDLPLEDIERIEVIRGPGAAVWGTNAANGVINIISKPASETLGTLTLGSVSRIGEVATIRYGGSFRGQASYRAYARYVDRRPFDLASGMPAFDGADTWRGGGQVEWHESTKDTIRTSGIGTTGA